MDHVVFEEAVGVERQQEIGQQEACKRVADAVLVARHDRGVRDRQSHRMAEQRGDREPVGQSTDHRRLGKGPDKTDRRMNILIIFRADENQRHDDEHTRRHGADIHPARGNGNAHPPVSLGRVGASDISLRRNAFRHEHQMATWRKGCNRNAT